MQPDDGEGAALELTTIPDRAPRYSRFAQWLDEMDELTRKPGTTRHEWLEWPTIAQLALIRRTARHGQASTPTPVDLRYIDRFRDRLVRRRQRLDSLGLFRADLDQQGGCGIDADNLLLPVLLQPWERRTCGSDTEIVGWPWQRFVNLPEGYLDWLEPEELMYLRSQVLGATAASTLLERSHELVRIGVTTPVRLTLYLAAAGIVVAAVVQLITGG